MRHQAPVSLTGVAFVFLNVEEASNSVTRQVSLEESAKRKCVHASTVKIHILPPSIRAAESSSFFEPVCLGLASLGGYVDTETTATLS